MKEATKTQVGSLELQRADVRSLIEADELLRRAPLLEAAGPDAMGAVLATASAHRAAGGVAVYREGEPARSLYLVLDGEIGLKAGSGKELIEFAVVRKGEFFGERELLAAGPRISSAVAHGPTLVAELSAEALAPILGLPAVRALLLQAIGAREAARRELDDFLSRW